MKRLTIAASLMLLLAVSGWIGALGQETAPAESPSEREPPLRVDKVEKEKVRLVLLDAVVVDRQGRTVPDLNIDDFEVMARGRKFPLDTLDVNCPAGAADDALIVKHPSKREAPPENDAPRRIVLAFDYQHLLGNPLIDALEQAQEMVKHSKADDEIMVVALTGGLRIEQQFSTDREEVARALHRMEYDISLWNGNFSHLNEIGFVRGLTTMFDVLGTVPGVKAVVLFSTMKDVPLEVQFKEMAAVASAARCTVYPVDSQGLQVEPAMAGGAYQPGASEAAPG